MSGYPSPCIDVCKYKMRGHCIGCSMTKAQKSAYKKLKSKKDQKSFIDMLVQQQQLLGDRFKGWVGAYRKRCEKKGRKSLV